MGDWAESWKHLNPSRQMAAVKEIEDQEILAEVAKNEETDEIVRIAAVDRLTSQVILAELSMNDKSYNIRMAAVKRLEDETLLLKVAKDYYEDELNTVYYDVRKVAAGKIRNQRFLSEIAMGKDVLLCNIATKKITDRDALAEVAKNAEAFWTRKIAVKKITDQETLAEIAINDSSKSVRKAALKKIQDPKGRTELELISKAKGHAPIKPQGLECYIPSGKHLSLIKMLPLALLGGAGVGAVGGLMVIIFSQMAVAMAKNTPTGGGITFQGLIVVSLFIWLIVFVPYGMGKLNGMVASFNSRNESLSVTLALAGSSVSLLVLVLITMLSYKMSLGEWINLSWATAKGPQGGFSGMAFFHLVPILVLMISSMITASDRIARPFCEACGVYCRKATLGEMPTVTISTTAESIITQEKLSDLIEKPRQEKDKGNQWGEATATICPSCKSVGFLSVTVCRMKTESGGKIKKQTKKLIDHAILKPPQLADLLSSIKPQLQ